MSDDKEVKTDEVTKELFIDGHILTIVAFYEQDFGWSLSIENEKGVSTNWTDFFSSAQEAIDAGLKAINEQGVDEFMGYDDFAYLYEDKDA